jgi:hypothetical protein
LRVAEMPKAEVATWQIFCGCACTLSSCLPFLPLRSHNYNFRNGCRRPNSMIGVCLRPSHSWHLDTWDRSWHGTSVTSSVQADIRHMFRALFPGVHDPLDPCCLTTVRIRPISIGDCYRYTLAPEAVLFQKPSSTVLFRQSLVSNAKGAYSPRARRLEKVFQPLGPQGSTFIVYT